ncbi:protein vein isoform X2 [Toxorhynchites rutilus septentrionalis]|uniref:protein vein isoform X2 n=1 Tax=Toxorhynchites rutilus septentrionalis TaxID=329112 RepID=UPI002478EE25|nr:protein vein isoform X2 [Toxorhynchites rutilus septentrionalis]
MYLRKWNPIKYLMFSWLAILVWIFCRCESAATMHLAPSSSYASSINSIGSFSNGRRNSILELFANENSNQAAGSTSDTSELVDSTSPYQRRPRQWPFTPESSTQRKHATQYLTKSISKTTSTDRRLPLVQVDRQLSVHHPINYANRALVANANKQLINPTYSREQKQSQLPILPASLSQFTANQDSHNNVNSSSSSIISTKSNSSNSSASISVENAAQAEEHLQRQWKLRMSQKRARRLAHRLRLAASPEEAATNRNRRDSARPSAPTSVAAQSNNQIPRRTGGPGSIGPGRRYCSARDPATLAFDAPVVFEGKVKSMSSDRRANFSVTFEIVTIHKKHTKFYLPNNVRLQFSYRNFSECDIYRETYRERGIVREELEQGKVYFLFVKQIDLGNFTILGQPIRKTRRTTSGVLEGVSETYGKPPVIYSITSNVTRQEGKRVRLVCKVRGQPPPKVTWFKDKRSINRNVTKYAQVHLKKRSELIIHSVIPSDAGEYECRAKNKYAKISNSTHVRIAAKHTNSKQPKSTHSTEPPYNPRPCRGPGAEHFCLNGGTCIHFEDLQEWACTCPKGFSGNKCENKDIDYHPTTSSKHQDCSYGYGYGAPRRSTPFCVNDTGRSFQQE